MLRKRKKTNMSHFVLIPHFSGELDSNSVEFDRIGFCPKLTGIKQNTLYILHTHNNEVFMKKRVCFTVSDEVLKKLAELAKKENRSMSAMVEQLVRSAK